MNHCQRNHNIHRLTGGGGMKSLAFSCVPYTPHRPLKLHHLRLGLSHACGLDGNRAFLLTFLNSEDENV